MGYAQKKTESDILQDQQREADASLARLREEFTTEGAFLSQKSLSADATNFGDTAANDDRYRGSESANDGEYNASQKSAQIIREEEQAKERAFFEEQVQAEDAQARARWTQQQLRKGERQKVLRGKQAVVAKEGVRSLGRVMSVTGAWVAYAFQFFFGALSLVFIGAKGVTDAVIQGNFVLRTLTKFIGLFVDVNNFAPLEALMMAFWLLSTLVALCTFFAFLLWFTLTRVPIFATTYQTFHTALTFTLSMLPVTNLFPWIPLWVMLVNIRSIFHSAKELFSK